LKGMERKAPLPLLHLNEAFGTSSGVLGMLCVSRRKEVAFNRSHTRP
jgi:hypothetical protein